MPKFLPVFPLKLVAYPAEQLNLHIFEPRYRELVQECVDEKKNFGIPSFIGERVAEMGTEMEILSVEKTYEDGRMDIRTRGVGIFKILEFLKEVPDKQYSAAIVNDFETNMDTDTKVASALFGYLRQFQDLVKVQKPRYEKPSEIKSYEVAHLVGMSVEQEYELLTYASEKERQQYIVAHLKKVIPVVMETERTKELAKLNGHFRNEIPPKF